MGTRLYVDASDAVIERLLGIPAGIAEKVRNIQAQERAELATCDSMQLLDEIEYKYYTLLNNDAALGSFNRFKTFGYGKCVPYEKYGYCGNVTAPEDIQMVLDDCGISLTDGVTIADIKGLHWN